MSSEIWLQQGWRYEVLPHYRIAGEFIETLGGRRIVVTEAAKATFMSLCETGGIAARYSGANAALNELIEHRLALPVPPFHDGPVEPVDLVLSPHIDDAALSLGATIAESRGLRRTIVINIFSRQRFQTGLRVPPEILECISHAEDRLAGAVLGYEGLYAGLEGAQDRHGWTLRQVFGQDLRILDREARVQADIRLVMEAIAPLAAAISETCRIDRVYAPAGVGGHWDHLILRYASISIARQLGCSPSQVRIYQDQPYAIDGFGKREREEIAWTISPCREAALALKRFALLAFATRLRKVDIQVTMDFTKLVGEATTDFSGEYKQLAFRDV